ncbi:hypothetical protein GW17_00011049 [Ensete ventricosum]|nr:hypothetical protein GW17_00011049 [Ensete ventricosum]
MRLNHVESSYVFLLHFRNKRSEEDGQPATALPGCGQGPLQRGDWLRPRPPAQGAVGCRATPARGSGQPARGCSPVGAAPARDQAARVDCPRQGHKGSAHPWPARRAPS